MGTDLCGSKRMTELIMLLFMIAALAAYNAAPAQAAGYPSDIGGNWAYDQIVYLVDEGIIEGYADGTFKPADPISRAEFIAMVNRACGYTETTKIEYVDVITGDWFYEDIAKAQAAGYIKGLPDGSMKPDSPITRQEVAVILARVMKIESSGTEKLPFSDADTIPGWSRDHIRAMVKSGLISGNPDGSFQPFTAILRDETASLIFRCVKARVTVAVTGVILDRSSITLLEGYSMTLTAKVFPANAYNRDLRWTSSDERVARVSNEGKVTAVKGGMATITVATVDGSFKDTCAVTVKAGPRVGLELPDKLDLYLDGNQSKVFYAYLDGTARDIDDVDIDVGGDDVVDVAYEASSSYLEMTVTGTAVGESTVYVSVDTDDGYVYRAACEVIVHQAAERTRLSMIKELTLYLDGNAGKMIRAYLDGTNADIRGVSWEFSGDDVIEVDYSFTGNYIELFMKGEKAGFCTLTVTAETEGGDLYSADLDTRVVLLGKGQEGTLELDNEVVMATNTKATVRVNLPGAMDTGDVEDINWVTEDENIVQVISFDDSNEHYIDFRIESFHDEGECTLTFNLEIDGDLYQAFVIVTVED